jgi:hypothetical protein
MALVRLTRKIFSPLQKWDIRIHACYISGEENKLADALSRIRRAGVFDHAERPMRVALTIDLFATAGNARGQRFVTLNGPSELTDALSMSHWDNGLPYAFLPVQLLPQVLQRIRDERANAVVVLPRGPSCPW